LALNIPNNKAQNSDSVDDKTFDNGIVNVRFTRFHEDCVDNVHAIMTESQIIMDSEMGAETQMRLTKYEKNLYLRNSIKTAMNMI